MSVTSQPVRCASVEIRPRRGCTITVDLPGAENDADVLKSALRYAAAERASMRIVLSKERATDAFQDQFHQALLEVVRSLGVRPEIIEVVTN